MAKHHRSDVRSENLTGTPLSLILLGLATPVRRYNPVLSKPNHHSLPLPLDCVLVFWVGGACLWRGLVRAARGYLRVNSRGESWGEPQKKAGQVTPQAARPPRLFSTSFMPRRRRLDRAGRCRTCVRWRVDGVPSRCACAALSRRARRPLSLSRGTLRRPRSGCR